MDEFSYNQVFTLTCPSPRCPGPSKIIRYGKRKGVQRYQCKTCRRRFSVTGKAKRKQVPAEHVGAAIDVYYSGTSYKQTAEFMQDAYDMGEPSKASVHDWVKGYTKLARAFLQGQIGDDGTKATATGKPVKAKTGPHWVADEMQLKVGGKKYWNWNVMDAKTRYLLASRISRGRGVNQARAVFRKALRAAERPPETITTDGLGSYVEAVKTVLPSTKHVVSEGIYAKLNNNLSERVQGTFRDRTKTQRGLETRRTAQDYLDGFVIDYNFFRDHEALGGRRPGEIAGVNVPWVEWADVVRMGGEIAEPQVRSETLSRHKSRPTPKPAQRQPTLGETLGFTRPGKDAQMAEIRDAVEAYREREAAERTTRPRRQPTPHIYAGAGRPGPRPGRGSLRF